MRFTRSITISRCFGIAILVASVALIVLLSGGSAEATHNGKNHGPKKGGGGGGGSDGATLQMGGGMVTLTPNAVIVARDNKNVLGLEGAKDAEGRPAFQVNIGLAKTQLNAYENPGDCNGDLDLRRKLVDNLVRGRNLNFQVNKSSLGSASVGQKGHRIWLNWVAENKIFDLFIQGATVTGPASGTTRVYEFTGGTVKVRDRSVTEMVCPIHAEDSVTVTVVFQ